MPQCGHRALQTPGREAGCGPGGLAHVPARVFLAGPRGRHGTPPAVQTSLNPWKGIWDTGLVGHVLELGFQAHCVPGVGGGAPGW